ncbi:hypothetical protein QOT17_023104 [Balamuthia mandrillaris]
MAYHRLGHFAGLDADLLFSQEPPPAAWSEDFWTRPPQDAASPLYCAPLLSPPPLVYTEEPLKDEAAFMATPSETPLPEQKHPSELDLLEEILFGSDGEVGAVQYSSADGLWAYDTSPPFSFCCYEDERSGGRVPPIGSGLKYLRRPCKRKPAKERKRKEQHQKVDSGKRKKMRLDEDARPEKRHSRELEAEHINSTKSRLLSPYNKSRARPGRVSRL